MTPTDIIATVIGVFTTVAAVSGMQFKNMKYILISQLVSNSLLIVQYLLQGTISGGGVVILAIVQVALGYVLTRLGKPFPIYLTGAFIFGYVLISALSYSVIFDIASCLAACLFAVSMVQKNSAVCRAITIVSLALWLVYDFGTGAYSAVLTHVVIITLTAVAVIRLDRGEWAAAARKIFAKGK